MNLLRAIALVLALATITTAFGDPRVPPPPISALGLLPGDALVVPAAGDQTSPAMARGGDMILVVWVDASSGAAGVSSAQSELDVVGVRLASDGSRIDQTPFVISRAAGYQRNPRVAWNGENWLVTWENQSPSQSFYHTEIVGVRVSPQGVVLDPVPIKPLGTDGADEGYLTANGSEWLVVTQNYSAGQNGLRARRIAADGSLIGAAPTLLVPGGGSLIFFIDLDSAAGEYLLTYKGSGTAYVGKRFSATLAPIGSNLALPPIRRINSNGSMYYVVFDGGAFANIATGSPMTPAGVLTIPGGVMLDDLTDGIWWETNTVFDGTDWWVSFVHAFTGLTFFRIGTDGAILAGPFALDPAHDDNQAAHALGARPDGGVVVTWQDDRIGGANPYDIWAAVVPDETPPYDTGAAISFSAPMQLQADLAAGPRQYLLTYASKASGFARVLAQRVSALGVVLDPEPIVVDAGPAAVSPAATWNEQTGQYMLVWNSAGLVVSRRMTADGVFVDPAPVTVMTGGDPDVAALGTNFLVAVTDYVVNPQFRSTFCRRMDGLTGQPIDPARFVVSNGNFAQLARTVTFGDKWLVVWQDYFSHDDPQSAVYVRFVYPDASISAQFTAIFMTGGSPDAAVSGDKAMIVWRNNSIANANNYIAGRRMNLDGTFADPGSVLVSEAPGRQLSPVAAWQGTKFTMAWEDQRNQVTFFDLRTDIYGGAIGETGPMIDPAGYPIVDEPAPTVHAALASHGDGATLFAASLLRDDPGFGTYRIGLKGIGMPAVVGDLNGDGAVNAVDLGLLLGAWGTANAAADLNGDGVVNAADLALLLGNWGGT